jgi:lysophospholipase L1-like esterase
MRSLIFLTIFVGLILNACGSNGSSFTTDVDQLESNDSTKEVIKKSTREADKRVYIIGDSTVHNNDYPDPNGGFFELGWGDLLASYAKEPENIYNLARSGASSSSYQNPSEKRNNWNKTKNIISQTLTDDGGYLLIQFGHNDSAKDKPYYNTPKQFYDNLKGYIEYARSKHIIPVLITPINRLYPNKHFHKEYVEAMKRLAQDEDLLLIDLNQKSFDEFKKVGSHEELAKKFGYDDHTHLNPTGALVVAKWVVELICQNSDKRAKELCSIFN